MTTLQRFLNAFTWSHHAGKTRHLPTEHAKGMTASTHRFYVYCPVGNIFSWNTGDYDNDWCPWCRKYFSEILENE